MLMKPGEAPAIWAFGLCLPLPFFDQTHYPDLDFLKGNLRATFIQYVKDHRRSSKPFYARGIAGDEIKWSVGICLLKLQPGVL